MRFQVPQFIEVEDKIFGPLTLKQFLYLAGSLGMAFVAYSLIGNIFISIFLIIPIVALGLGLAFYKINNKPFIFVLEAAVKYYVGDKLYIWRKKDKEIVAKKAEDASMDLSNLYIPKLSDSKLKDLTWSLDIKQSANPVQSSGGRSNI